MTISVWRYSHLALAVSSFLFVALAAVTGCILAFEPLSQKASSYRSRDFDALNVAQTITVLKHTYPGITDITVDANQFVTVKGTDAKGKKILAYTDPKTGKVLGHPGTNNAFFQWVKSLHRSLFLHEAGRFFVGLTSFLLLLIALSGTVLIIQRQRSFKRFFGRIVKENFAQYYHVVLGRLTLIPIIIIALSGTYLSLSRFGVFPEKKIKHLVDLDNIKSEPQKKAADFPVFQHIKLADVQTIEFPFSDFPEDYYTLKLKDKELVVNQFTGEILSEVSYPKARLLTNLSLDLHTGRTNAIWAVILAIAAVNIIFFIYSGFVITLKRLAGKTKNKYKADDSDIIILVGSENGSTMRYAGRVYTQLVRQGHKAFITELNNYTAFPGAKRLIIMTSTYGLGDAPANANKFTSLLQKFPQQQHLQYAVVGFGSHAYPDFCQFAFKVNQLLLQEAWASPLVDIHTVNDKSPADLMLWAEAWSQQSGIQLSDLKEQGNTFKKDLKRFTITANIPANSGRTFLLRLKLKESVPFTSGDLLAIYPADDHRERLYSIGVVNEELQLSVRLHPGGLGSEYLSKLSVGQNIRARIVKNTHFHFPEKAPQVIMVCNGTGIAPFLGMISQNDSQLPIDLYCGFRVAASLVSYNAFLEDEQVAHKLKMVRAAFSREGEKQYVSDLLKADAAYVGRALETGGVIMICGSLAMQKDVLLLLQEICTAHTNNTLSFYQSREQILMDCY